VKESVQVVYYECVVFGLLKERQRDFLSANADFWNVQLDALQTLRGKVLGQQARVGCVEGIRVDDGTGSVLRRDAGEEEHPQGEVCDPVSDEEGGDPSTERIEEGLGLLDAYVHRPECTDWNRIK